jgi:RNA polymerase sigma factor (sigma-70 family)
MAFSISLKLEESDIILACVNQESWAQQKLYEELYSFLMGVCMRYAQNREEATDWLHDGFIKIFLKIHLYKPDTSLKKWTYRLMVNVCIDHIRKQAKQRLSTNSEFIQIEDTGVDALSQLQTEDIIHAIQQLSSVYRLVFNMFVIEGYTHKEIAEQLNITESTSRSNLSKARIQLRRILNNLNLNE